MQDIEFNSVRSSMLQIFARDLITVPAAEPNMEEISVRKIDGMIVGGWPNNGCRPEMQRSGFLMIANIFIKSATCR